MCPSLTEDTKHLLTVHNFYNNEKQRVSFSIDLLKCSKFYKPEGGCKDEKEVDELFEAVYFNLNIVTQNINFRNDDKAILQPLINFHS